MSSALMPSQGFKKPISSTKAPLNRRLASLLLLAMVSLSAPAQCQSGGQDGAEWDRARAELKASAPTGIAPAIARWRQLAGTDNQGFDAYAGFVLAWPGFPQEEAMRKAAERALALQNIDPARVIALFDRFPPLTNPARATYALALSAQGREDDAATVALAAWRGGVMSDTAEATILSRWGDTFSSADHEAHLEALLWDGATAQATRALPRASASLRALAQARLAIQQGQSADTAATPETPSPSPDTSPTPIATADMLRDPGYLVDRARFLLRRGRAAEAAAMLASRPALARLALDPRRWVATNLAAAKAGGPSEAMRIATSTLEGFPQGADISQQSFGVRDDYTSLMWLGGTAAQFQLNDPEAAAQLFWRYGTAARTPMTRSKGFYWAGRALESFGANAGHTNDAARYFAAAGQYPNQYYGLLALERLGQPIPPLHDVARAQPSPSEREKFLRSPIAQAVREVARDAEWQTTIRFFREISAQAKTEADFTAVTDLAKSIGRRDLAVIAGQAAENAGFSNFRDAAFPIMPVPQGANWTIVHAITRQESQFSYNAISRTSARGLMQLMPATAADTARRNGMDYSVSALFDDPLYNLTLGNAYFASLLDRYRGSYPLAIAAYNAGAGNVNKWLAARGDPRTGQVDWAEWIERIPFSETRGYVTHVLENAVTYEAMYPEKASYKGPNPLSHFIGKPNPG